ncbi:MAG: aspartate aminotransferase family protein [Planctomycetota bacterium]
MYHHLNFASRGRRMTDFNLRALVEARQGEQMDLLEAHLNPRFAKVLRTIGFDRQYVRGEGQYLWDEKGNRYLDFLSGYGMFNTGRNHPVIKQAIRDYLDLDDPWKIQMGQTLLSGLLAEQLKQRLPYMDRVFFTNSGTECVEAALKFARGATGRERVIYCDRAFHGLSYGSLSLNGCESFRKGFVSFLPGPVSIPYNDLAALEKALKAEKTAALVIEPVQGKGVYPATPEYLLGAQALCRKHGAKLVIDEVQTGMGRTGKLFATQHVPGLEPDILLVSKSLSGGFVPVGAVLYRKEIYDRVFNTLDRSVVHSSTFGQGGLAMACGLASLHVIENEHLAENAADKGGKLLAGLQAMVGEYDLLKEVRGAGLMIAIEFGAPKSLSLRAGWSMMHAVDGSLFPQALIIPLLDNHHILTQVAGHHVDIIKLLPPLVISDEDVQHFLTCFEEVLKACHKFPGPIWEVAKKLTRFAVTSNR